MRGSNCASCFAGTLGRSPNMTERGDEWIDLSALGGTDPLQADAVIAKAMARIGATSPERQPPLAGNAARGGPRPGGGNGRLGAPRPGGGDRAVRPRPAAGAAALRCGGHRVG